MVLMFVCSQGAGSSYGARASVARDDAGGGRGGQAFSPVSHLRQVIQEVQPPQAALTFTHRSDDTLCGGPHSGTSLSFLGQTSDINLGPR